MYCDCPSFARCCFCFPLRKGLLVFGYLNVVFSMFIIGIFSVWLHIFRNGESSSANYRYISFIPIEVQIALYCVDIIFNCLLLYGAHRSIVRCLKVYYYFVITTIVSDVVIQITEVSLYPDGWEIFVTLFIICGGLFFHLYLALLVRSLIKKLDVGESNRFFNQLHQIVTGEEVIENTVYYNNTMVPK